MSRIRFGITLALLAMVACGGEPTPRILSSMPSYTGPIRVEGQAGGVTRVLEGTLEFDRRAASFALVRADGARLSKAGDGPLVKELGGASATVSPDDLQDVTLLLSALYSAPAPETPVTTVDGGYVIAAGGQQLTVWLGAAASD